MKLLSLFNQYSLYVACMHAVCSAERLTSWAVQLSVTQNWWWCYQQREREVQNLYFLWPKLPVCGYLLLSGITPFSTRTSKESFEGEQSRNLCRVPPTAQLCYSECEAESLVFVTVLLFRSLNVRVSVTIVVSCFPVKNQTASKNICDSKCPGNCDYLRKEFRQANAFVFAQLGWMA